MLVPERSAWETLKVMLNENDKMKDDPYSTQLCIV